MNLKKATAKALNAILTQYHCAAVLTPELSRAYEAARDELHRRHMTEVRKRFA